MGIIFRMAPKKDNSSIEMKKDDKKKEHKKKDDKIVITEEDVESPDNLIVEEDLEPINQLKEELDKKKVIHKDDILKIQMVFESTSSKLNEICEMIKDSVENQPLDSNSNI